MITPSDFLHLSYSPDLTEGGITYACHSLTCTFGHLGDSTVNRLRRIVGNIAVELAFQRTLSEQGILFKVLGAAPFTQSDQYNISLGGHRCELKSFLITRRQQIALLRQNPTRLLQAPALVSLDEFVAEGHKPDDLYVFAFLLGVVASAREDVDRATAAGQPTFHIHPLPDGWARPANWLPLENLALKSECEAPITVEIGGQNAGREFIATTLELPPKKRVPVEQCYTSLAYIHAGRRPEARIGLHSPTHGEAYIVPTHAWGNIWVYGMDIFLTGWLTHDEYRRKAKVLNAGMSTLQYARTRVKNLLVPMVELNPLAPLLKKVKAWEMEKNSLAVSGSLRSTPEGGESPTIR